MSAKGRELSFPAVISRDGRFFRGHLPDFPGVNAQGDTREQAKENLVDALKEMVAVYQQNKVALPEPKQTPRST